MKRGYVRPSPGHPAEEQLEALEAAGIPARADETWIEDLSLTRQRAPEVAHLTERASAIRQLRAGDQLVVASLSDLALSLDDLAACLAAIAKRGAVLFDALAGKEYRWHPDAASFLEAAAVFEKERRHHQTAKARAAAEHARTKMGVKKGRLRIIRERDRTAAREDWGTSPDSAAKVAKRWNVSVRTMYHEFGPRTEQIIPRRKRKKGTSNAGQ